MKKILKLTAVVSAAAMSLSLAACSEKKVKTVSYEDAERGFLNDGVGAYSSFFAFSEGLRDGNGGELTIEFTPEKYILELMGTDNVNPTVFNIKSEVSEDSVYADIVYKNGKKELLAAEMWMRDDSYIMFIPALVDKYITGSLTEGTVASFTGAYAQSNPLSKMPEPPSDAEVARITNKLWEEYFALTKDAVTEKGVDVTVGGVTLKCDKTVVDVDGLMAGQLALTLLEEIRDSEEMMRYATEFVAVRAETDPYTYADFNVKKEIDDLIARIGGELDSYAENGEDTVLSMTAYVNGAGIVKRDVTVRQNGEEAAYISCAVLKSGKDYASEFEFESYEEEKAYIKVSDSGTESGGAYTGETTVKVLSDEKSFTVKGAYAGLSFDEDGNFSGGEITLSSDDLADESFSVNMKFGSDSFTGGLVIGGAKFATVKMTYKKGFKSPAEPAVSASDSVSAENSAEGYDYVSAQIGENLGKLFATADDNGTYDIIWYILQSQMTRGYY